MKGSLPRRLPEALRFRFVNLKITANNLRFADAFEEPFLVDCLNDARIHHRGDVGFLQFRLGATHFCENSFHAFYSRIRQIGQCAP